MASIWNMGASSGSSSSISPKLNSTESHGTAKHNPFGSINEVDFASFTLVSVIVIVILLLLENFLKYMERLSKKWEYQGLLEKTVKELMILGIISFLSFVELPHKYEKYYHSFEVCHFIVLFIGLTIVAHSFFLVLNSFRLSFRLNVFRRTSSEMLIEKFDELKSTPFRRFCFLYSSNFAPFPKFREAMEFKIIEKYFIYSHGLPYGFNFAEYLARYFKHYVVRIVEIPWFSWLLLASVFLLNYARMRLFKDTNYNPCPKEDQEAHSRSCPRQVVGDAVMFGVVDIGYSLLLYFASSVYFKRLVAAAIQAGKEQAEAEAMAPNTGNDNGNNDGNDDKGLDLDVDHVADPCEGEGGHAMHYPPQSSLHIGENSLPTSDSGIKGSGRGSGIGSHRSLHRSDSLMAVRGRAMTTAECRAEFKAALEQMIDDEKKYKRKLVEEDFENDWGVATAAADRHLSPRSPSRRRKSKIVIGADGKSFFPEVQEDDDDVDPVVTRRKRRKSKTSGVAGPPPVRERRNSLLMYKEKLGRNNMQRRSSQSSEEGGEGLDLERIRDETMQHVSSLTRLFSSGRKADGDGDDDGSKTGRQGGAGTASYKANDEEKEKEEEDNNHNNNRSDHNDMDSEIASLFMFASPKAFFYAMEFGTLLQCVYSALWATNFLPYALKLGDSSSRAQWIVAVTIPPIVTYMIHRQVPWLILLRFLFFFVCFFSTLLSPLLVLLFLSVDFRHHI